MQIKLNNIGIIKESEIVFDGLTVITGKNNSGKTTVGKVLYSLLDAVKDIEQKSMEDKSRYIRKKIDEVQKILSLPFSRFFFDHEVDLVKLYRDYPALEKLLNKKHSVYLPVGKNEVEDFAHTLLRELKSFNLSRITEISNRTSRKTFSGLLLRDNTENFRERFDNQRIYAISILERMFIELNRDSDLVDYARKSINQTLKTEFYSQIQPVRKNIESSKIELLNNDSVLFDILIQNNKIVNEGKPVYFESPFNDVYFIDDPFIIDENDSTAFARNMYLEGIEDTNRIQTHSHKLKSILSDKRNTSVLEQTILDESLKDIKDKIDKVIPGTFEFTSDGNYYVKDGTKLRISNLATGSKMFSIIKMLLESGKLGEDTMLILDEPEAHLHPEWQNSFAEVIVLLVKELKVNVLLTTHSPNFMLAIDANMRKYNISDKTNFYQTKMDEEGFVQYDCVSGDMSVIYQDFLQYLSEVKVLRNMYLDNIEG